MRMGVITFDGVSRYLMFVANYGVISMERVGFGTFVELQCKIPKRWSRISLRTIALEFPI